MTFQDKYDSLRQILKKLEKVYYAMGVNRVVGFSAVTGSGKKQVWHWIDGILGLQSPSPE